MLARNFIVDFWNHSELSMGALNYDTNNALPLALYQPETLERIRGILASCDGGAYGDGPEEVARFLAHINEALIEGNGRINGARRGKHHDLNFSANRVEIRSVRPQASVDIWLNQIELIESRILRHLKPMTAPLPLKFLVPPNFPLKIDEYGPSDEFVPPVRPARAIKAFHRYVTETGLDWRNHRGYIWPGWQEDLKVFECESGQESGEIKKAGGWGPAGSSGVIHRGYGGLWNLLKTNQV